MNDTICTLVDNSPVGANVTSSDSLDLSRLHNSFDVINQRYFGNAISASIIWQVPKGLVSINKGTPSLELNATEQIEFEQATKAIESGHIQKALALLTPLADKGHGDSELLVCHMLKRNQNTDWQVYARAYNQHFVTEMMSPAACYYPESRVIAIHPHLHEREVPMFVLRYLIYHECCHQMINSTEAIPHPPEFMEYELKAPFRDKALLWLDKEGFPTLHSAQAPLPAPLQ
ncbi:hypothetical protein A9Q99_02955 [Gammaproteobacteria bacterium 45_16_T64]|nr:hypothetical protein A9Q99_02955 [Gammaproteobacteria bacterium 45_16_T64]